MSNRFGILGAALVLAAAGGCGGGEGASGETAGAAGSAVLERDPCALLTRAEAEAVLGALVAGPFRAREDTTVADPGGTTCAYQTDGGRYFLVTPEWTYGKSVLDSERLVGGLVRLVADLSSVAADTLEGTWDEAVVGISGELLLRKGPRSLTIGYLRSSTDAAGAIRLSAPALARLAAAAEPSRPAVSADGCPLPAERVSEIIAMPVRLAPRPVRLTDACAYELVEDPTVEVELAIRPVEIAEMVFEGLHSRVKALLGESARADSVPLGEEGWAYRSGSGTEAAVRAGSQVYHAKIGHLLSTAAPEAKDAMTRLVGAMMEGRER